MFFSARRHEKATRASLDVAKRLADAVLKNTDQGFFLLNGSDHILPQVSLALTILFRRHDFTDLTLEQLLAPIVPARTLGTACAYVAALVAGMERDIIDVNPLQNVAVRLSNSDGSYDDAQYCFQFHPLDAAANDRLWLVRVNDITGQVRAQRELDDLRLHVRAEGEILRAVLQRGGARFGQFLQQADASMKTINTVLRKSARAEQAFRCKLEETLGEVDRLRRDAATFNLTVLEEAAGVFQDSLHELRSRTTLSGSDFLPLAVKLDHLFGRFMLIRSLTLPPAAAAAPTAVVDAASVAPSGSLEHTLLVLTEHVADEQQKRVVLQTSGLQHVPPGYHSAVKNVAIQLIRNAVLHGIEAPQARAAAGKPPHGTLRLEFKCQDGFELSFDDDGCGLDPDKMRTTAIERGLITLEAARRLRDREAIKLIFKSGFTTLATASTGRTHGAGMGLVRRYIHEAGGRISLASLQGHETRFRITLPPLKRAGGAARVA